MDASAAVRNALSGLPIILTASFWSRLVGEHVPEPYLDEIFHIPQAQKYCFSKWSQWDDKITTPPGLYLISRAAAAVKSWLSSASIDAVCGVANLRAHNAAAIVLTFHLAVVCRDRLERNQHANQGKRGSKPLAGGPSWHATQTGYSVALFPVLFFFSGLYYTDVVSTLAVLLAYYNHLQRVKSLQPSLVHDFVTVMAGTVALFMRQTNIFWVAVYMGGLEAVGALKALRPPTVDRPTMHTVTEQAKFFAWRSSLGDVHDPTLDAAWPHDLILCALSLAIAAVCNPSRVLRQTWPYIVIMTLFAAFVVWNGSVVLGDKSNHVATLHLAQMLYIWPLFAFFSAPLFLPTIYRHLKAAHRSLTSMLQYVRQSGRTQGQDENPEKLPVETSAGRNDSLELRMLRNFGAPEYYQVPLILSALLCALVIIRNNTIIHPFTLADNRHYMFYIFRYTIRRPGHVREGLLVVYALCQWLCWGTLSSGNTDLAATNQPNRITLDGNAPKLQGNEAHEAGNGEVQGLFDASSSGATGVETAATTRPASSTVVLLFLTTTLSLVTAPLVEPRYFILPWVFWRLLVPAWRMPRQASTRPWMPKWLFQLGRRIDLCALFETAWFAVVNAATMWVFLHKPYVWKAEDGTVLEEGRPQRFMW